MKTKKTTPPANDTPTTAQPFELIQLQGLATAGWNTDGTQVTLTITSREPWNRAYTITLNTTWLADIVTKAGQSGTD